MNTVSPTPIEVNCFSTYHGSLSVSVGSTNIEHVVTILESGSLKEITDRLRSTRATDPKAYDVEKRNLPAVAFSGIFSPSRSTTNLKSASGLICIDIDKLGDNRSYAIACATKDPKTLLCFTSPSGDGIKVVYRIAGDHTVARHKAAWLTISKEWMNEHGIKVDEACKDIARLCFLAHDENLYVNLEAKPLVVDESAIPAAPPKIERDSIETFDTPVQIERAIRYLQEVDPTTAGPGSFAVACRVRDFGISQERCVSLMCSVFNPRRDVERTEAETSEKVDHAYRYAQNPAGIATHESAAKEASGYFAEAVNLRTGAKSPRVKLLCADDVTPENVEWFWFPWLAAGKIHLLGGAPGTGKTTLAITLAAAVSSGGRWPDGSVCQKGSVVMWTGEDSIKDTLVPRIIAAGGDRKKIFFVQGVAASPDSDPDDIRAFDPGTDMAGLLEALQVIPDVKLVIVDPIVSTITGDSHKNSEVRRGLSPLEHMAGILGCSVLGITHFSKSTSGKDPVERLTGSIAFGAVARVVMVAAKDNETEERLFLVAKSNIGPDDRGGYRYSLRQCQLPGMFSHITNTRVEWGQAVVGKARDILEKAETPTNEANKTLEAEAWLADALKEGAVPAATIKEGAKDVGIAWNAVKQAKATLGVKSTKGGVNEGWSWSLPSADFGADGFME